MRVHRRMQTAMPACATVSTSAQAILIRRAPTMQVYSADPTILSWNLINEPRCKAIGCNKDIQAWVEEMAPYLKGLDPNHLVTVGASPAVRAAMTLQGFAGLRPGRL